MSHGEDTRAGREPDPGTPAKRSLPLGERFYEDWDRQITGLLEEELAGEPIVAFGWARDQRRVGWARAIVRLVLLPLLIVRHLLVREWHRWRALLGLQKWVYVGEPYVALLLTERELVAVPVRFGVSVWGFLAKRPRGAAIVGPVERLPLAGPPPALLEVRPGGDHALSVGATTAVFRVGYTVAHWRRMEELLAALRERGLVEERPVIGRRGPAPGGRATP